MLKQLIPRNYNFVNKDNRSILVRTLRTFTSYRRVAKNSNYYWEINRKRMNFSVQPDYKRNDCNESMSVNKNNDPSKNMEKWNVVSFFFLMAGMMGYLLINSKASEDAEEKKEIENHDLQPQEEFKELSMKLEENLPATPKDYVDLQGKKEILDEKLNIQEIVIISGIGGIGKSTLAAEYGNMCKQRENVQVIWIKGTQIEEEFLRLARILGIETNGLDGEMIRNLVYANLERLNKKRILFIFDNVEKKEKIEKYLINLPNAAKMIITARNRNLLEGIRPIRTKGFNREEAIFYLRKALKINEEECEKIIHVVGESPFRLCTVVTYLNNHSLSVEEYIQTYLEIKKEKSQNQEIYPEVELLFGVVKKDFPKAWELLKYLAYLDAEGIPVSFIAKIMEQKINKLQESVNKLLESSLIKIVNEKEMMLKLNHRIIQDEVRKALMEEDETQVSKVLQILVNGLNNALPDFENSFKNIEEGTTLIEHWKTVIEAINENNVSIIGKRDLLIKVGSYYYKVVNNYYEIIYYLEKELNRKTTVDDHNDLNIIEILNFLGVSYRELKGESNLRKASNYLEEALKKSETLFSDKDLFTSAALDSLGTTYVMLGGRENVEKGIELLEKAMAIREEHLPGNHPHKSVVLNNLGLAYAELGGDENIKKGTKYLKKSVKMCKALFSSNHPDIALTLMNLGKISEQLKTNNVQKELKYKEEALKIYQALSSGNNPNIATSLDSLGTTYRKLGGENTQMAIKYQEEALKMRKMLFLDTHPLIAVSLNNLGLSYKALGGNENIIKGLKYQEEALKMKNIFFQDDPLDVANSLKDVGKTYLKLGDDNKYLEYLKQAYSIHLKILKDDRSIIEIKQKIESLEPNFFTEKKLSQSLGTENCLGGNGIGYECRWLITSRGNTTEELIKLKQKIQKNILDNVVKAVNDKGWSSRNWRLSDEGVNVYLKESYLKKELKTKDSSEIEMAQMLCFETMNLGIMRSTKKPYAIVESFTRENPAFVKKIAIEHPEFFVDGSIVEACIKAMPKDKSFEEHILRYVKYVGMELRQERGI